MKYELDKISLEVVHVLPQVAARLGLGVAGLRLIIAWNELHERRLAEVGHTCRLLVVILHHSIAYSFINPFMPIVAIWVQL